MVASLLLADNVAYTGWHSGYPDALVKLDLSTYRRVPWDHNVPFFLGEFERMEQLLTRALRRQGVNAELEPMPLRAGTSPS